MDDDPVHDGGIATSHFKNEKTDSLLINYTRGKDDMVDEKGPSAAAEPQKVPIKFSMKEKWAILVPFEVGVVILLTSAIWYSASFMTYIMAIVLFIVVLPLIFGEHSMSAKEIKHVLILLATFIVILPLLVMLLTDYFSVVVLIPLCASFSLFSVAYFSILLNHAYQARLTL